MVFYSPFLVIKIEHIRGWISQSLLKTAHMIYLYFFLFFVLMQAIFILRFLASFSY